MPVSLRARLTLAFACATAVVLVVVGLVVYLQFASGITSATDAGLVKRQRSVTNLLREGETPNELRAESGERLLQIYRFDGSVVTSSRELEGARLLLPRDTQRATRGAISVERDKLEDGDEARVRAFPAPGRELVVAIGESLERDHRLRLRLAVVLAIALPGALLLASYLGYRVAGAALTSVERMRRQAASITESDLTTRLPVPETGDELQRLGVTFNALLDRLADAVERERRLVSDASHELRTPLSVLRAELEVALLPDRSPDGLRAAIQSALEETQRLSRLADDLLVLARADQGQLPLRSEPLDVADLLEDARRRHAGAAAAAGRRLSTAVNIEGGAVVLADSIRVAQALDNLMANALRHGEGPIRVRADGGSAGGVVITVSDAGPGFPETLIDHAFERFSQGDRSHSGTGSGLGLAIVDAIARAHGGSARAMNAPGGGASVSLELPEA